MNIDLAGRTALVTGSTSGHRRARSPRAWPRRAPRVIVNGRDPDRTEAAAAARLGDAAGRAPATGGHRRGRRLGRRGRCLLAAAPDVNVLVNNAGIFTPTPVFEIPDDDWMRTFEVNVMSGVRLARDHVPGMVARGWGRVLFISSESALQIPAEMVHYGMSKTAQVAVARGMAESIPGQRRDDQHRPPRPDPRPRACARCSRRRASGRRHRRGGAPLRARAAADVAARALIAPEEVANAVVYLASEQASATTGAAVRVDGGVVRAIP